MCLVLFSGGQDSTICLYWAKRNFSPVHTLSFSLGSRREEQEITAQDKILALAGIPVEYRHRIDICSAYSALKGMATDGIPGRNLLFLALAGSVAKSLDLHSIVLGACSADYTLFPDCRETSIIAGELFLVEGLEHPIDVLTPIIYMTKAEEILLAKDLPGCMEALAYTHTCYKGTWPPCKQCAACKARAKGFKEAGVKDPLETRASKERKLDV